MRVLVSGWIGSTNLGDELVFAGVHRLLQEQAELLAVSTNPAATRRDHGVPAIDHRRFDLIATAAKRADLVVVGGGGLIQDETSPFNLPYHLSRPWLARLGGTPWVGIALGVGPLSTALGRRVAGTLRFAAAITVRDEPSAQLLTELGVESELSADAAYHLAVPSLGQSGDAGAGNQLAVPPGDRSVGDANQLTVPPGDSSAAAANKTDAAIVVSLRPWSGGGGLLPVGWRAAVAEPDWFVPTLASALERASLQSRLPVRFVALQTDRDHELHLRVAAAMTTPTQTIQPARVRVLDELANASVVVAMRYHAGVGATIAGRPSVLIGYSPKVDALAASLGSGAAYLPFDESALRTLDEAVLDLLASETAEPAVRAAADRLHNRAGVNAKMLARFLV